MRPAKGFLTTSIYQDTLWFLQPHNVISLPPSPSPHSSALCSPSLPDFISYSTFRLLFPSPRSLLRLHFSSFQAAEEQGKERGSFSWWQNASVPLCVTVTEISPAAQWAWSCETGLPVSLLLSVLSSSIQCSTSPPLGQGSSHFRACS